MAARLACAGHFNVGGVSLTNEAGVRALVWRLDSFASLGFLAVVAMVFMLIMSASNACCSLSAMGMFALVVTVSAGGILACFMVVMARGGWVGRGSSLIMYSRVRARVSRAQSGGAISSRATGRRTRSGGAIGDGAARGGACSGRAIGGGACGCGAICGRGLWQLSVIASDC